MDLFSFRSDPYRSRVPGNLPARQHSLQICAGSYTAGTVRYNAGLFNFLIH